MESRKEERARGGGQPLLFSNVAAAAPPLLSRPDKRFPLSPPLRRLHLPPSRGSPGQAGPFAFPSRPSDGRRLLPSLAGIAGAGRSVPFPSPPLDGRERPDAAVPSLSPPSRGSLGLRRRPLTVTCVVGITGCGESERDEWILREHQI